MANDQLYTIDEIATRLSVHPETVRNWIRNGQLLAINLGGSAGYRVSELDLQLFIRERRGGITYQLDAESREGHQYAVIVRYEHDVEAFRISTSVDVTSDAVDCANAALREIANGTPGQAQAAWRGTAAYRQIHTALVRDLLAQQAQTANYVGQVEIKGAIRALQPLVTAPKS
jgi:excisionase family DNA binding protein